MKKFDVIDALLAFYRKHMPETVYLMKNPERYPKIEKAVEEISSLVLAFDNKAKVKIAPDTLTGSSLCLSFTTNLIVIDEIDKFCSFLSEADTIEICPLKNGQIDLGLTFKNTWIPAPTHRKSEDK